ncbi:MAG: hypothetical protein BWX76_00782 [Candidatus Cloacimonetes bacterium ADurb.Bin089]|nr:MAG: hypothetical protein BWX76_00782 [Candidatus Cloacimonetes bacterium ADurb.Bin089]
MKPPKHIVLSVTLLLLIVSWLYAGKKRPEWISQPYSLYPENRYLCGLGMAKELNNAQNEALKNIAGFFETRVIAVTKTMESEKSSLSGYQTSSETSSSVKAIADGTIKYTQIKETWQDPKTETYYALAVMDKIAVQNIYRKEIDDCEEFIENCLTPTDNPLVHYAQILSAIDKLQQTQDAYTYYNALASDSGIRLRPFHSLQELMELRTSTARAIPLQIKVAGDSSGILDASLKNVINQMGLQENDNSEYKIVATVNPEPYKSLGQQLFQPLRLNISFNYREKNLFSFVDKTEQGGSTIEEATSRGIRVLAQNIENKFRKDFNQYLLNLQ